MKILVIFFIFISVFIIPINTFYENSRRRERQEQGVICYDQPTTDNKFKNFKQEEVNQALIKAVQNSNHWEHGFTQDYINSQSQDIPNIEFSYTSCNIIQSSQNFQKDKISKRPTVISSLNQELFNDNQFISQNLREFDQEQIFSYNSTKFLKYNLDYGPKIQEFSEIVDTMKNNTVFTYVYIASEKPLRVYISGSAILDRVQQEVVDISKFVAFHNPDLEPSQIKEKQYKMLQNIREMATYIVFANYKYLLQRTKHFEVFEMQYYLSPSSGLPHLQKIQYTNIFQTKKNYYKEHQKLYEQFTRSIFIQQMEFIETRRSNFRKNRENQDFYYDMNQLNETEPCEDEDIVLPPKMMRQLIDETTLSSSLDDYLKDNQENNGEAYQKIYKKYYNKNLCFTDINQNKNVLFYQWYENNQPDNWTLFPKLTLWQKNVQNCNIIMSHIRSFQGQHNHNPEKNVWNYTPFVRRMHNKDYFYELLRSYDDMNYYKNPERTFNSTQFLPETYVLSFNNEDLTDSEKAFFDIIPDFERMYIYKPRNFSKAQGIELITDIEKFQKEMEQYALENMPTKGQEKGQQQKKKKI